MDWTVFLVLVIGVIATATLSVFCTICANKSRRWWTLIFVCTLAIIISFVILGFWQLQRADGSASQGNFELYSVYEVVTDSYNDPESWKYFTLIRQPDGSLKLMNTEKLKRGFYKFQKQPGFNGVDKVLLPFVTTLPTTPTGQQ